MEKNRQTKVIAIIALVVAVIGMSVGFAAFSNTLIISSSATVTPNSEDFKMVAYGLGQDVNGSEWSSDMANVSYYTSTTIGKPVLMNMDWIDQNSPISATTSKISRNGDTITISDLSVNFSGPEEGAMYPFMVKNEGAYDAYLSIPNSSLITPKACTAGTGATVDLVNAACENIGIAYMVADSDGDQIFMSGSGQELTSHKIAPGEQVFVMAMIIYDITDARADGPFDVEFDDFTFNFSSAA